MGKKRKKPKKHFLPVNDATKDIHTDRSTPRCYRGTSVCVYKSSTRASDAAKIKYSNMQDHHIVPVSVLIMYQILPDYDAVIAPITAMYHGQDYCANNIDNLIWLPMKGTYAARSKADPVWDLNLPCHDWGHPAYTNEVRDRARQVIWDPIKESQLDPDAPCPDVNIVEFQLKALQGEFRNKLKARGIRPGLMGGTRFWQVGSGPRTGWWMSFSMADAAVSDPVFAFAGNAKIPDSLLRRL